MSEEEHIKIYERLEKLEAAFEQFKRIVCYEEGGEQKIREQLSKSNKIELIVKGFCKTTLVEKLIPFLEQNGYELKQAIHDTVKSRYTLVLNVLNSGRKY